MVDMRAAGLAAAHQLGVVREADVPILHRRPAPRRRQREDLRVLDVELYPVQIWQLVAFGIDRIIVRIPHKNLRRRRAEGAIHPWPMPRMFRVPYALEE